MAKELHYGELVELADTLDLGSSAAKHKGSSPLLPTTPSTMTLSLLSRRWKALNEIGSNIEQAREGEKQRTRYL